MKKTILLVVSIVFLYSGLLTAQTYDQQRLQLQFFNHYGKAYQRGNIGPKLVGSEYMHEEWMPMDIQFRDTSVRFEAVKINLMNSNLEVLLQGEEKVIANYFFKDVTLSEGGKKKQLVPANFFTYNNKALQGFMEVLGDGAVKVLVQHYIFVKEPHAQAHITGGYTTDRLLKSSDNYIYDGEKLTLVKSKNDLKDYYRRRSSVLDKYMKEGNYNIKDSQQLLTLVEKMSGN
ncbi:MAG: hypothetical protein KF852_06995 [Saprospiraceae bacterium]|nr:hypothetical protein [Saprospiraceae bacterium]